MSGARATPPSGPDPAAWRLLDVAWDPIPRGDTWWLQDYAGRLTTSWGDLPMLVRWRPTAGDPGAMRYVLSTGDAGSRVPLRLRVGPGRPLAGVSPSRPGPATTPIELAVYAAGPVELCASPGAPARLRLRPGDVSRAHLELTGPGPGAADAMTRGPWGDRVLLALEAHVAAALAAPDVLLFLASVLVHSSAELAGITQQFRAMGVGRPEGPDPARDLLRAWGVLDRRGAGADLAARLLAHPDRGVRLRVLEMLAPAHVPGPPRR